MWSLGLAVELFLNKELSPICVILISLQSKIIIKIYLSENKEVTLLM